MINELTNLTNKFIKLCRDSSRGAGILFICTEDNTGLLLLRSDEVKNSNTWGIPGGGLEDRETPVQAARRETIEEIGSLPKKGKAINSMVNKSNDKEFQIYIVDVPLKEKQNWKIKINKEHKEFKWFNLGEFPKNLHKAIDILG